MLVTMTSNLSENETGVYVGGVASFVPTHINEISQRNRHLSPATKTLNTSFFSELENAHQKRKIVHGGIIIVFYYY